MPSGSVRIRVIRLGYEAELKTVTINGNETVTADFALGATATRLDQVVVSATGESELRRESGNNVATINTDSIPKTIVNGVSDLLSSRAANVVVTQTSGTTGGGSRIRIRGSNSLSLSNEPLIIIDGVRAISDVSGSTIDIGGQNPSRLDDLNPEDIDDIEIIKGPAAAALYGTAAANGVVQITTKRGRAGKTQWTAYADGGSVRDVTAFPANYGSVGLTTSATPRRTTACSINAELFGLCTPKADSLISFNPLEQHGPFVDGWRERVRRERQRRDRPGAVLPRRRHRPRTGRVSEQRSASHRYAGEPNEPAQHQARRRRARRLQPVAPQSCRRTTTTI